MVDTPVQILNPAPFEVKYSPSLILTSFVPKVGTPLTATATFTVTGGDSSPHSYFLIDSSKVCYSKNNKQYINILYCRMLLSLTQELLGRTQLALGPQTQPQSLLLMENLQA